MRIVHLSDMHLNKTTIIEMEEYIIKALIRDLKTLHDKKKIDLIVFSGDLIDKGGKSFQNNISLAFNTFEEKIINPIIRELDLPKERFFFVPGNHDINRDLDSHIAEIGMENFLFDTTVVNQYIDSESMEGRQRIKPFKEFEEEFYQGTDIEYSLSTFQSSFKFDLDNLKVGITSFNSSWRCFDSSKDQGKVIIGERQVLNARRFLGECDVKIAIMHHQIDWLAAFERQLIETMICREYDMLFTGHIHEGSNWSKTSMYGTLFTSVAPANWTYDLRSTDRVNANGYAIIDYINNQITVNHRRYAHLKESFDPNTDLGNEFGITTYQFPGSEELSKKKLEIQLSEKINSMYMEEINEHLLSYGTETNAPKNIQQLFVLPRIVKNEKYEVDDDENDGSEVVYDLEDLCGSSENILLFGNKEAGKTVLLDRLLIELTDNISKYHKIPVYINFDEFSNNKYDTAVSRFLGMGILETRNILEHQNIVLLIDNITFGRSKYFALKKLEHFIETYPNVSVIATCTTLMEGEIPVELFEYPKISSFLQLDIKNFKTKEIRALMQIWFSSNTAYDNPQKLDNLLNIFTNLNIPRTPLAVSMFLWIIEQQENYKPVNNATMLENFVERLFLKQSRKEIYSEEFDYRNKERLLTEISLKMYTTENVNYRLTYNELRNFIYEYLKIKKFDFQEEDVLQHFISKGIFIKESDGLETFVRFRFSCFFKFFLMKNMFIDSAFKEYVLHEDKFLSFIDEIDYFTGLKRDESDILELLVTRMENEFKDIIEKINNLKNGFDTIFETKRSIASTLDEGFVQRLTEKNKPSEEELDEIKDDMLDTLKPEKGIPKKEDELSPLQRLERLWTIAAMVLKNTEETKKENLKTDSFISIIRSSIAYSCLYKTILMDYLNKNKDTMIQERLPLIDRFLPLIHQLLTHSIIGTGKLKLVIREVIDQFIDREDITDYEKFMAVFLYSDLKGDKYTDYISKLVKNIRRSYMSDMILFKLVSYYFIRSHNRTTDLMYENLIADIITQSKGLQKVRKDKIMKDYRSKKKFHIENHEDNLGLEA